MQTRAPDSTRQPDVQSLARTRRASEASANAHTEPTQFRGHRIRVQRLVDPIFDKAKAYIDKFNVATMDGPIKVNRLKKATEQADT